MVTLHECTSYARKFQKFGAGTTEIKNETLSKIYQWFVFYYRWIFLYPQLVLLVLALYTAANIRVSGAKDDFKFRIDVL